MGKQPSKKQAEGRDHSTSRGIPPSSVGGATKKKQKKQKKSSGAGNDKGAEDARAPDRKVRFTLNGMRVEMEVSGERFPETEGLVYRGAAKIVNEDYTHVKTPGAIVNGNHCQIDADGCIVNGSDCTVYGDRCIGNGARGRMWGNFGIINGGHWVIRGVVKTITTAVYTLDGGFVCTPNNINGHGNHWCKNIAVGGIAGDGCYGNSVSMAFNNAPGSSIGRQGSFVSVTGNGNATAVGGGAAVSIASVNGIGSHAGGNHVFTFN